MKKTYVYNTPKGIANNAAQKQRAASVTPITKHPTPPVCAPEQPATIATTEKGQQS